MPENDTGGEQEVPLGMTVATQGALAALTADDIHFALLRHVAGDWGDLEICDKKANDSALVCEGRLVSAYHSATGVKFYIITEWDRSYTTVLLPSEY